MTLVDRFVEPYMGKSYLVETGYNFDSFEIGTMGIEMMTGRRNGIKNLTQTDPEMARFILGLLAGV